MSDRNFTKYRHQHESNAEWNIRRKFFEKHSQKFPEDRLICLSMCHLNVEVYGCTYPPKVMRRLKDLRDGVFWFLNEQDNPHSYVYEKKKIPSCIITFSRYVWNGWKNETMINLFSRETSDRRTKIIFEWIKNFKIFFFF